MTTKQKAPSTARKRTTRHTKAEEVPAAALQASERRFETVFHNAPVGMAIHKLNGEYLETNAKYDELFGYSKDFTLDELIEMVSPESKEATLEAFNTIASKEESSVTFQGAFTAASGETVHAVVQLSLMPDDEMAEELVIAQVIDVTELKETQQRLEESLTSKNQFLAAVSHELRTPLTAVIGLAELLRDPDQDLSAEQRTQLINTIVESGFDVSNMVEDLLTAARQEAGQLEVVSVPVHLQAQTRQALEVVHGDVEVQIMGDAPAALADPGRVRQILRNLLTNAFKYGGDEIRVDLDSIPGFARATVSDNGPGVPSRTEDLIFASYARAHTKETHPGSVGIGLSISRELARQMGGDLVYLRRRDKTCFILTLPIHRRLPPQPH